MNNLQLYNTRFNVLDNVKYIPCPAPFVVPEAPDKNQQLFDLIFAPDATGHVNGDVAMYLGEKTSPQVREFIKQNLMNERSDSSEPFNLSDSQVNAMRKHITDDDIAEFSRNHGESKEEYALRIREKLYTERYQAYLRRDRKRLQKIINGDD